MAKPPKSKLNVESLKHDDATRKNIPAAEYQSMLAGSEQSPVCVVYERRNRDPQLIWRGKDEQGWSDLAVNTPPIYVQERVHPKVLIDDLRRRGKVGEKSLDIHVNVFAEDLLHVMKPLLRHESMDGQAQSAIRSTT